MRTSPLLIVWTLLLLAPLFVGACEFARPDDIGPAQILITAGDSQSAVVGSNAPAPFVVTVEDGHDMPLEGVAVDFVVTANDGTVSDARTTTDAHGRAQTQLTLGTIAGENLVEARVTDVVPALLTATGFAGPATQIVLSSGDHQTGAVGAELAQPLVAAVEDEYGNAIEAATVDFVVSAGGGSLSLSSAATNPLGHAQTSLTLGTTPGTNTVEVHASGLPTVAFSATAVPGSAMQIALVSGNNQTAIAGTALAAPLVVTVKDGYGNVVPGTTVDFVVTAGGGTVSTGVVTDAAGHAQTMWTLGTTSGTKTVEARVAGASPFVLNATGIAGPATRLDYYYAHAELLVPGGQTTVIAIVTDVNGNPVSGVTVNFAVTAGGGTTSDPTVVTTSLGRGSSRWNAGAMGTNTIQASSTGLAGSPLSFTGTALRPTEVPAPASFGMSVGDFNSDGKADIAIGTDLDVRVLLNTTVTNAATATFAAAVAFPAANARAVAVGDFNGDGKPDLAVANYGANNISVLLNTTATGGATPTFAAKVDLATGSAPTSIAVGDFNKDGKPDLAVANFSSNNVSILLDTTATNATTPTFAPKVDLAAGTAPRGVAIGDLNADGYPDIAVVNFVSGNVSIMLDTTAMGATTATFAPRVDFVGGGSSIAIGDLNGDGKPDLAVASGDSASVMLNTTAGGGSTPSLTARVDFYAGTQPDSIAIGDVDGNGKPDLVLALFDFSIVVQLNATATATLTPSFGASYLLPSNDNPTSAVVADFNTNGRLDLACSNQNYSAITVDLQ